MYMSILKDISIKMWNTMDVADIWIQMNKYAAPANKNNNKYNINTRRKAYNTLMTGQWGKKLKW